MSEGYPNPVFGLAAAFSAVAVVIVAAFALAYFVINADGFDTIDGVGFFFLCTGVFVLCLALLIYDLVAKVRECPDMDGLEGCFRSSGIVATGSALAVMLFISVVIVLLTSLLGAPIEADFLDDYTDFQLATMFMMAGPEEEFLCRFLLIGIPMALVALIRRHGHPFRMLLGGFGATKTAWIFIIISAIIFAALHLDGWNASKLPQIFATGVIFGYVFSEYGLHATIVMHSVLDCMSILAFYSEAAEVIVMLGFCAAGLVLLIMVLTDIRRYLPETDTFAPECDESILKMWMRHR